MLLCARLTSTRNISHVYFHPYIDSYYHSSLYLTITLNVLVNISYLHIITSQILIYGPIFKIKSSTESLHRTLHVCQHLSIYYNI